MGDPFGEIADTSAATVDVAVDENDVALLNHKNSMAASVKLDGFPSATFKGTVDIVSPKSEASGDHRIYYARVTVPNPDGDAGRHRSRKDSGYATRRTDFTVAG